MEEITVTAPAEARKINFPEKYLANPTGNYKGLITSWVIERGSQSPHIPKLTLEFLPLSAFELNNEGERTELELVHKGRFPVRFAIDLNYYAPPTKEESKKSKFVKAITGGTTVYDFLNMFNKLKGKQVILKLEKVVSGTSQKEYYKLLDIKPVAKDSPLPEDYKLDEDGSTILGGMTEAENWVNQIPTTEWKQIIRDCLLPDSDYVYLIPRDGAADINQWIGKDRTGNYIGHIPASPFIRYSWEYLNIKGLRIFWINKVAPNKDEPGQYPEDLTERVQAFEEMGLKPVSKEWLWNVIKSGGNVYNQVDEYFKENMPDLYFKKEFSK